MTMEQLALLFRKFHEEERESEVEEIDFEAWAEKAFEAVMGKALSHDEEDSLGLRTSWK